MPLVRGLGIAKLSEPRGVVTDPVRPVSPPLRHAVVEVLELPGSEYRCQSRVLRKRYLLVIRLGLRDHEAPHLHHDAIVDELLPPERDLLLLIGVLWEQIQPLAIMLVGMEGQAHEASGHPFGFEDHPVGDSARHGTLLVAVAEHCSDSQSRLHLPRYQKGCHGSASNLQLDEVRSGKRRLAICCKGSRQPATYSSLKAREVNDPALMNPLHEFLSPEVCVVSSSTLDQNTLAQGAR